jgi:4-hydroxy-4-methyl-2-oxoglutarate aldolase
MKSQPTMNLEAFKAMRAERKLEPLAIPDQELCERYEALFTAAVNDVLRERGLTHQTLPNNILPLRESMKVAGPAFTIKGAKSLLVKDEMKERAEMLESIPTHAVVAWDTSGDDESAQWGEVMTMAAVKRGCRGAIVDGGVRDTDRVLPQNFPVFVKYRTSNGMLGRFRISGWQVPIRIGEVDIFPGDIVFGDIDGVIVVPRDMACDVLVRAEEIAASESQLKKWVEEGLPATEIVARGGYF